MAAIPDAAAIAAVDAYLDKLHQRRSRTYAYRELDPDSRLFLSHSGKNIAQPSDALATLAVGFTFWWERRGRHRPLQGDGVRSNISTRAELPAED